MVGWLLCALNIVTKMFFMSFLGRRTAHLWYLNSENGLVQFLQIPTKEVKYFSFQETTI